MDSVVARAELMAVTGHDAIGQKRKFTDLPYHTHCRKVAELVAEHTSDKDIIAAGWVHDLLEDTGVTSTHIATHLGNHVAMLVLGVTKYNAYGDNEHLNLLHEIGRFIEADEDVCLLKLCDIRANVADMSPMADIEFIAEWVPKKIAMVLAIKLDTCVHTALCDAVIQFIRSQVKQHFPVLHTGELYLKGQSLLEQAIVLKDKEEDADVDAELNV